MLIIILTASCDLVFYYFLDVKASMCEIRQREQSKSLMVCLERKMLVVREQEGSDHLSSYLRQGVHCAAVHHFLSCIGQPDLYKQSEQ